MKNNCDFVILFIILLNGTAKGRGSFTTSVLSRQNIYFAPPVIEPSTLAVVAAESAEPSGTQSENIGVYPKQTKLCHIMDRVAAELNVAVEAASKAASLRDAAEHLVEALQKARLKTIASDFDKTMITVHSGGAMKGDSTNSMLRTLSSSFNAFATEATKQGISVSVVTFSDRQMANGRAGFIAGEKLVRRVLEESHATFPIEKVYGFYPRLYTDRQQYLPLGLEQPMPNDKSYHISKLCTDMGVHLREVILVDDDIRNCNSFARAGGIALHVVGDKGFAFDAMEIIYR